MGFFVWSFLAYVAGAGYLLIYLFTYYYYYYYFIIIIIIIIIIDRACEVVRILRISPFSLKKGTCQAPRHFDLDYRLLDTVNLLLLSLYMYLIVIQEAFAVLTSSFSGK